MMKSLYECLLPHNAEENRSGQRIWNIAPVEDAKHARSLTL